MNLFVVTTETPVGLFQMIVQREIDEDSKNVDIVRASGFGDLETLRGRLPTELRNEPLEQTDENHPYTEAIKSYFAGNKEALSLIPYKQEGSDFNHNVWRAISNVQPGKTASYKELALAAGSPAAIRAAGTVCGENRLILLVPCHRILKSDGSIGQYLYGQEIKEYLLKLEGAV